MNRTANASTVMAPSRRRVCRLLIGLLTTPLLGCGRPGRDVQLAPLSGRVIYRGKPVTKGQVVLVHDSGEMGMGEIQPDGSYRLQAAVGENQVMIEAREQPNPSQVDPEKGHRPFLPPRSLIPERYGNYATSGLRFTIVEGDNTKEWHLVD